MSTLDLFDDSFPHGTPDGYRRGCKTIACPALIPCRTVHTRYSGDYTFARMIDAGMPLSEILEQDAAAKEGIHQRDRAAARQQQRAAAPTHRAAAKPKTAARPKAAPHPDAHATPAVAPTPIRPLRPHPGHEWLTRAAADIDSVPEANRAQRQRDLADYRTALDHHVTELEQWRQERADLRRQLAAAAATLRTASIAAGTGLSVNGAIESALQNATTRHQSAVDALTRADQQRPAAPPQAAAATSATRAACGQAATAATPRHERLPGTRLRSPRVHRSGARVSPRVDGTAEGREHPTRAPRLGIRVSAGVQGSRDVPRGDLVR